MRLDVVLEALLPQPVEAVWRALTDAETISEWLMPTTGFRPAVGARVSLKTQHLSPTGRVDAEGLALDPLRRMAWAWSSNDGRPPTTVAFELEPEAGGTRLRVTHEGEIDPTIGAVLDEGWPGRLELLAGVVATKEER